MKMLLVNAPLRKVCNDLGMVEPSLHLYMSRVRVYNWLRLQAIGTLALLTGRNTMYYTLVKRRTKRCMRG
jgi:hypothetical protein